MATWAEYKDALLVQTVLQVGAGRCDEVGRLLREDGCERTEKEVLDRYTVLKTRAEAQREPLIGAVNLWPPFNLAEDAKLLALQNLHKDVAAVQEAESPIAWSSILRLFPGRGAPDLAARSEEVDRSASRREEVKRSALLDQAKHELRRLCPALDLRRVVKDREAAAAASAYAKGAAAARAQWSNLEQDRRARPPPQSTSYLRTGSVLPPVLSPPQRRASYANHPAETFHPTPVASTANPATRHPSLAPSSLPLHQLPPPSSPLIFNDDVHLLALVELHDAAASAATAAGGSFPEQWADVYATAFPGTSRTKLAQRTEELSRYSRDGMKSAYVERLKGRLEEAKKNVKTAFPFLDLARTAGGAGGGWSTQRKTAAMSQRTSPADQLSPFAR